jgi:hypothetical protein
MPKRISFATYEEVSISLVHLTRCVICQRYIHYNGITPKVLRVLLQSEDLEND